jgi:hypothetical protein
MLLIASLIFPIYAIFVAFIARENIIVIQMLPLLMGWLFIGRVASMKRYMQFESLFAISITPADILVGNLLALGIYYIYVFLVYLPLYLANITICYMTEFRILFILSFLLIASKSIACYLEMLIKKIHIIQWAIILVYTLAILGWRYIQTIPEYPYACKLFFVCFIMIVIIYILTIRLSKERVILSSE